MIERFKYIASLLCLTVLLANNPNEAIAQPTPCASVLSITACADLPTFQFSNCTVGAVSCFWDFGDGLATNNTCDPTVFANYLVTGPGTYQVVLTVCDGPALTGNCDTAIINVVVYALPTAAFTVNDQEGCAPFTVCFTDQSTVGDGTIINWLYTYGDAGSSTGTQDPCYTYPPTSLGTWDVTLQVVDDNGCSDTSTQFQYITVHKVPVADFTMLPNLGGFPPIISCNPNEQVTFTDNSTLGDTLITQWGWDFGDSNTDTGNPTTHTYTSAGTFIVTLIITDANGCTDTTTQTVRIDDFELQAGFTTTNSIGCGSQIVTFIDTTNSLQPPNSWLWDFNYDGPGTFTIESTTGPNVGHYYPSPGNPCIALVVSNVFGCTDTVINCTDVIIYPQPNVGFIVDTVVACDYPFPVTFSDTTNGAVSWIWDIDNWTNPGPGFYDWSTDYTDSSFTNIYTDTGCYNISLIVTDINGCVDTAIMDDLVCITKPIAEFFADTIMDTSNLVLPFVAAGCVPLRVNFADLSSYDTTLIDDSIVSWYWDFGDGYTIIGPGPDSVMPDTTNNCLTSCTYNNPTHIYVDTGTFIVTLAIETSRGCTDTITINQTAVCIVLGGPCQVDVGMVPQVAFTVNDTVGCHPFAVEFTDLSSSFANEWAWDFGDGGTDQIQDPSYTYSTNTGFFDVSLIAIFNKCESDQVFRDSLIEVLEPRPEFNVQVYIEDSGGFIGNNFFCWEDSLATGGWMIEVRDTTKGAQSWVWNMGDTNTTYPFDTTFIVNYDTLFTDGDTAIFPLDTIFFKAGDTVACDTTWFVVHPADTFTTPDTMVPPDPPVETFFFEGDYIHWLGMPTTCVIRNNDTTIVEYVYHIQPLIDTIIDTTWTVWMSEQYVLTPLSSTLFGCSTLFDVPLSVDTIPQYPIVTIYGDQLSSYIPNDSISIDTTKILYQPDTLLIGSRDTITSTTPNMVVIGTDTFNVIWDSIWIDTVTYFVPADTNCFGIDTVEADTTAPDTTFVPADTILSGFCDSMYIPADTIIDPPDSIFEPERRRAIKFHHTYGTPGTKIIWLYTWKVCVGCPDSICVDSTSQNIFISHIETEFTINAPFGGDTADCVPGSFFFEDITTTIYDAVQRVWDFGDGFILISPPFPFINNPIPPNTLPSVCAPGGSMTGSYQQVNHIYCDPGTYDVKMVITDQFGCKDSVTHQVVVNENPIPSIIPDTTTGCVQDIIQDTLVVTFTDTVTYPLQVMQWIWNYGDGTATDTTNVPVSPPHQYTLCGTWNPTVNITDENGCVNQNPVQSVPIITTCPNASFTPTQTTICSGSPLTFISTSTGSPVTYYWDWCDGTSVDTTSINSASHIFTVDTTTNFRVTLTIEDANGCRDTASVVVTIEKPVADFYFEIADIDTLCPNIFTLVDNSSSDVVLWTWTFGDSSGTTTSDTSATHTYQFPGQYDIGVIVTTGPPNNCTDTLYKPDYIVVRGPILLDTSVVDSGGCAPYKVTFTITTFNTDIITIFFGDGGSTSVTLGAITGAPVTDTTVITYYYTQGGTFQPILQLEDPADSTGQRCPYQYPLPPITVPGPLLGYFANDIVCGPRIVSFIDSSFGTDSIDYYWWDFGDGDTIIGAASDLIPAGMYDSTTGTFNEPTHYYANPGIYNVTFGAWLISGQDTCKYEVYKPQYIVVFDLPLDTFSGCPVLPTSFNSSELDFSTLPYDSSALVWDFGDGSPTATGDSVTHTYQSTGETSLVTYYSVSVTFSPTCVFVRDSAVAIYPTPLAAFGTEASLTGLEPTVICIDSSLGVDSILIWDFDDNSGKFNSYPNNPNVSHAYSDSGTYNIELTVCNTFGCCDDTQRPKVVKIKIPNVFNPASEVPQNSVFYIGNFFAPGGDGVLTLHVYNRWGEQVYESDHYQDCNPFTNGIENCWNGTDEKGRELGNDTYFYVLDLNNQTAVNGYVIILRPNK